MRGRHESCIDVVEGASALSRRVTMFLGLAWSRPGDKEFQIDRSGSELQ